MAEWHHRNQIDNVKRHVSIKISSAIAGGRGHVMAACVAVNQRASNVLRISSGSSAI